MAEQSRVAEAQRLARAWVDAYNDLEQEGRAYDEWVDWVESENLNGSAYDPRRGSAHDVALRLTGLRVAECAE